MGSTSDTEPPWASATHTAPAPLATPMGPSPTGTVRSVGGPAPVAGTTRVTTLLVPVTHRTPKPTAIRTAPAATGTAPLGVPVNASNGVSEPAVSDDTQTVPPSTARPDGPAGTPMLRTTCSVDGSTSTTSLSTMSATHRCPPATASRGGAAGQVERAPGPPRGGVEAQQQVTQVVGDVGGTARGGDGRGGREAQQGACAERANRPTGCSKR